MFRNGTPAPDFYLPDERGHAVSLHALRNEKTLVLLFFRGAFCATSRRDLLAWADIYERVQWLDAELCAISVDAPPELAKLKNTMQLPFTLLSDQDFSVSRTFNIYASDETDAGPQPHGEPGTFVIDNAGNFVYSQTQSGPKGAANANEIILMLVLMQHQNGRYW